MEEYGINEAFEDLDALDRGSMDAEQRAACIVRLRGFVARLNEAFLLMENDT